MTSLVFSDSEFEMCGIACNLDLAIQVYPAYLLDYIWDSAIVIHKQMDKACMRYGVDALSRSMKQSERTRAY